MGALVTREPTMNRRPASWSSFRFDAESIPASATTTMSESPWRCWNCFTIGTIGTIGTIVCVSALLPSAADLEGEPGPVDQKTDHDLGVDASFFGEPDLA